MPSPSLPSRVRLVDVGPRDGLQNEKGVVPTEVKVALIEALADAGVTAIEATSFVSPKWVPQMADAADVMQRVRRRQGVRYSALVPNMKGFEGALAAKVDEVVVFGAASEAFSQKNINCSIAESLDRFRPVLARAKAEGVTVRGYVSCVTDCPYEGHVAPEAVARVAQALHQMGCREISLGDTIGHGTSDTIGRMLDAVLSVLPADRLAGHYHDTRGMALRNIAASLDRGIRTFDASVGGLGGCPYAPGAKGNVATEAVAAFLHVEGFATGLDLDRLSEAARFAQSLRSPQ